MPAGGDACPLALKPQQASVPSLLIPQICAPPALKVSGASGELSAVSSGAGAAWASPLDGRLIARMNKKDNRRVRTCRVSLGIMLVSNSLASLGASMPVCRYKNASID
jgi:hypothetical protein